MGPSSTVHYPAVAAERAAGAAADPVGVGRSVEGDAGDDKGDADAGDDKGDADADADDDEGDADAGDDEGDADAGEQGHRASWARAAEAAPIGVITTAHEHGAGQALDAAELAALGDPVGVEHLEEVIDRFPACGQTTTAIVQSSPIPARGSSSRPAAGYLPSLC